MLERTLSKDTTTKVGQEVVLRGWVHARRPMGKVSFLNVRDRSGMVQVVVVPGELDEVSRGIADDIRPEYVLEIQGIVQARGAKQVNATMTTGTVEVLATSLRVLNACATPPFESDKDTSSVAEELRLKHRYLDLRSERLQHHIKLRSRFVQLCREFLFTQDFTEIETPLLSQATPEGSRDFVVPSRLQPGKFFALPQSPQQYKQLLMVAGFERYFQTARALRDEDPRADRGFEHTQIDLEMSFVERDDVMRLVEAMMVHVVQALGFTIKEIPFPRIAYKDAMALYGADKFDLRTDEDKAKGVLAYAWVVDFPFFEKTDEGAWTFTHNPFSNPLPEFREDHLAGRNIEHILTSQYDLVCNGYESGGGSIRAHDPNVLKATYNIMGYSEEEIQGSVSHMLEAFRFGAPPHGGIALGVERNLMNLTGEQLLREVVAFPMTGSGRTSVMHAPGPLPQKALDELGLALAKKQKNA
ncbi:aspartate--tRNA ligase [Candidatus Uhrbacteria bacterium]|nr:aspartate--tRNA ligase [Candidatus Uhrbacteria bacterium]